MSRYIDADYLLKEISFYADRPTKSAMKMIKAIALHPADVVDVVRCKDCELCDKDDLKKGKATVFLRSTRGIHAVGIFLRKWCAKEKNT